MAHGGKGASNPYAGGGCTAWAWANRPDLPGNLGNARYWGVNAARAGFPVDNTPQVGAIAVYQPGSYGAYYPYGHVAVVTAIQGSRIQISEASYPYDNIIYRGRWTGIVGVQFIHQRGYAHVPAVSGPPSSQPSAPPASYYIHHVTGTCRDGACGLKVHTAPSLSAPVTHVIPDGSEVDIVCQAMGDTVSNGYYSSAVWDRQTDGSWVSDFYVDTPNIGTWSPPIPRC